MTNQSPKLYAFLIGINFYFPHRFSDGTYYNNLRGCVQDINHIETYLKNTFNLSPEQIIKLTASASDNCEEPKEPPELLPTYKNIIAKFNELIAKAQPQDRVYIHYSGHGGRAKTNREDLKGFGGLDEGLVPTDIGQENSNYLRDYELAKLLEEMVAKELVVTLVLDSCHSGGASRDISGDSRVRGGGFIDMTPRPSDSLVAPPGELAQNWRNLTEISRNITVVNGLLPSPRGYTLIAACRDNELAYEDVFEGTERNGALTYFLLQALRDFGAEIPVETLYNRISNLVHNRFERQTPMLLGESDNRTFFGSQIASTLRHTTTPRKSVVMKVDVTKNRVQLQVGEAINIKKGAEFEIYRLGTRDFKNTDGRIATVKIVELGASECWAEVTALHGIRTISNKITEGMIEIGSPAVYLGPGIKQIRKIRVILSSPPPQIPGVNVALLPEILKEDKKQVEGHRWIEFCSDAEKDENVDYFVSVTSEGEYLILDANKEPIKNLIVPIKVDEPQAIKRLINRLIHLAKYQSILALDNEEYGARLNGKLKVELGKSVQRQFTPLTTDSNVPVLKVGERVILQIHNESNLTLNITGLILQTDLSIVQFYPQGALYEVVEPGQYKETRLDLELPENYEEGVDIIKVFGTVNATDFRFLELPALDQSRKGAGNEKPKNALEQLLAAVVDEDSPQRNIKVVTDASEEWTTEKIEMVIKKI
jgi:hypothetical protein